VVLVVVEPVTFVVVTGCGGSAVAGVPPAIIAAKRTNTAAIKRRITVSFGCEVAS
jgi:hypothetical protein